MLLQLVGVELGRSKGKTRRYDALDSRTRSAKLPRSILPRCYSRGVVRKIEEQSHALQAAVLLEIPREEPSSF